MNIQVGLAALKANLNIQKGSDGNLATEETHLAVCARIHLSKQIGHKHVVVYNVERKSIPYFTFY